MHWRLPLAPSPFESKINGVVKQEIIGDALSPLLYGYQSRRASISLMLRLWVEVSDITERCFDSQQPQSLQLKPREDKTEISLSLSFFFQCNFCCKYEDTSFSGMQQRRALRAF